MDHPLLLVGWGFPSPDALAAFLDVPALQGAAAAPPAARAAAARAALAALGLSFARVPRGPWVVGAAVAPPGGGRCASGVAAHGARVAEAHERARAAARRLGLDTRVALQSTREGEVDAVADCSDPLLYFYCAEDEPPRHLGSRRAAVRRARPADAPALAALARALFVEAFATPGAPAFVGYAAADLAAYLDEAYAEAAVEGWVAGEGAVFVAADAAGALVGYAHAGANSLPSGDPPGAGELKRLYVRREEQGTGLALRLWGEVRAFLLPSRGPQQSPVVVGCWRGNARALAFYERLGFRRVGAYQFAVGAARDDEVILRLGDGGA